MANKRSLILFCLLVFTFVLTALLSNYHQAFIFNIPDQEKEAEKAKKEWDEIETQFEAAKAQIFSPENSHQALKTLKDLETRLGENTYLMKIRLQCQIFVGQNTQAQTELKELIKVYDGDPDFYRLLCISSLHLRDIKTADQAIQILFKLNERDPYNYVLSALILSFTKQHDEAKKFYDAAKQVYGPNFDAILASPLIKPLCDQLKMKKALENE